MPNKDTSSKPIVIDGWQKGIANSPWVGFGTMQNVDTDSVPGVLKIRWISTKKSSTTITAQPYWLVPNPKVGGEIYAIDSANAVYKSTNGGITWATAAGNNASSGEGAVVWKNYLFVFRSTTTDVYGPLDGSPSWSNSWLTITSSTYHPGIWGQDDILYFGNDRYIGSIAEVSGQTFAPGNSATYTTNTAALTLPAYYKVKCLGELGANLMIGTFVGANIYDLKIADIFPWDRVSPSFRLPIRLRENGINAMVGVNNLLYFVAGIGGKLFVTDGVNVKLLAKIPESVISIEGGSFLDVLPGSIIHHDDKILWGFNGSKGMGVWSYSILNGTLKLENTVSTGNTSNVLIGGLCSVSRETYLIGWRDTGASAQGVDMIGDSSFFRYTSYTAFVNSLAINTGNQVDPRTFQYVDILLAKPLTTGQGVKISYRNNLTSSFTTLATFDFATQGAKNAWRFPAGKVNFANMVQLQIALTTGSSSSTTPELLGVVLS